MPCPKLYCTTTLIRFLPVHFTSTAAEVALRSSPSTCLDYLHLLDMLILQQGHQVAVPVTKSFHSGFAQRQCVKQCCNACGAAG